MNDLPDDLVKLIGKRLSPVDRKKFSLASKENRKRISFDDGNAKAIDVAKFKRCIGKLPKPEYRPMPDYLDTLIFHDTLFYGTELNFRYEGEWYSGFVGFETRIDNVREMTLSVIALLRVSSPSSGSFVANLANCEEDGSHLIWRQGTDIPSWWFEVVADFLYEHVDVRTFGDRFTCSERGLTMLKRIVRPVVTPHGAVRTNLNNASTPRIQNADAERRKIARTVEQGPQGIMGHTNAKRALNDGTIDKKIVELREKTVRKLRQTRPPTNVPNALVGGTEKVLYEGKTHVVRTGPKGGRYIVVKGTKVYV